MAMNTNLMIASGLSGLSVLLLLGLIAFGSVMLVENLLAVYFFFSTGMLYSGDAFAQRALLSLRALQLFALGFLTYVTMR